MSRNHGVSHTLEQLYLQTSHVHIECTNIQTCTPFHSRKPRLSVDKQRKEISFNILPSENKVPVICLFLMQKLYSVCAIFIICSLCLTKYYGRIVSSCN